MGQLRPLLEFRFHRMLRDQPRYASQVQEELLADNQITREAHDAFYPKMRAFELALTFPSCQFATYAGAIGSALVQGQVLPHLVRSEASTIAEVGLYSLKEKEIQLYQPRSREFASDSYGEAMQAGTFVLRGYKSTWEDTFPDKRDEVARLESGAWAKRTLLHRFDAFQEATENCFPVAQEYGEKLAALASPERARVWIIGNILTRFRSVPRHEFMGTWSELHQSFLSRGNKGMRREAERTEQSPQARDTNSFTHMLGKVQREVLRQGRVPMKEWYGYHMLLTYRLVTEVLGLYG